MNLRRTLIAGAALTGFFGWTVANAQEQPARQHDVVFATAGVPAVPGLGNQVVMQSVAVASSPAEFVSAEFGVGTKVVKGAPYTAEAVTENVQTLTDGNRIAHKSSAAVARDSEGRTRRDISLPPVGPWAADSKNAPRISVIFDPVTNSSYTLQHNEKIARKLEGNGVAIHHVQTSGSGPRTHEAGVAAATGGGPGAGTRVARTEALGMAVESAPMMVRMRHSGTEGKTEALGKQTMEGVVAEGTRTIHVIPAGEIGNDRPIEIVSERWYSPELQAVVMTRNVDPRSGEMTYKLTNIRRAEPLKSLFEVPADYTVKTETPHVFQMRTKEDE